MKSEVHFSPLSLRCLHHRPYRVHRYPVQTSVTAPEYQRLLFMSTSVMSVDTCVCLCTCVSLCVRTSVTLCAYVCVCVYVCESVCMCVCVHVRESMRTYVCESVRTYTETTWVSRGTRGTRPPSPRSSVPVGSSAFVSTSGHTDGPGPRFFSLDSNSLCPDSDPDSLVLYQCYSDLV